LKVPISGMWSQTKKKNEGKKEEKKAKEKKK
jgi:hypothetical protein